MHCGAASTFVTNVVRCNYRGVVTYIVWLCYNLQAVERSSDCVQEPLQVICHPWHNTTAAATLGLNFTLVGLTPAKSAYSAELGGPPVVVSPVAACAQQFSVMSRPELHGLCHIIYIYTNATRIS